MRHDKVTGHRSQITDHRIYQRKKTISHIMEGVDDHTHVFARHPPIYRYIKL